MLDKLNVLRAYSGLVFKVTTNKDEVVNETHEGRLVEILVVKLIADLEANLSGKVYTVNSHRVLFDQRDYSPHCFLYSMCFFRRTRQVLTTHLLLSLRLILLLLRVNLLLVELVLW